MIQGIRTFRTPVTLFGLRRQVAAVRYEPLSKKFIRSSFIIVLAALAVVVSVSQLLHWRIVHEQGTLEQLQSIRRDMGSENIRLLAARARLMSPEHVEAVAGVRLQLYSPEERQLHRL